MLDAVFAPTFAITYNCNMFKYCRYCYAKDFSRQNPKGNNMAIADFKRLVKLFIDCGVKEIVLVGGEPTVHKDFPLFLEHVEKTGLKARMFTNGFYSQEKSEIICRNKRLKTLFFHYDDHYLDSKGEEFKNRYLSNLISAKSAGKDIYLRCNFHLPDFRFHELVNLAVRVGVRIAYSFTTPAAGEVPYIKLLEYNRYLLNYKRFVELARTKDIKLSLARPLPFCMFRNEKEIAFFKKYADLQGTCVAIKDLTINPDGGMQLCLVTFSLRRGPITSKKDLLSKLEYFKKLEKRLHVFPPTEDCKLCGYFPRKCQGGCFAFHTYSKETPERFKIEK